ncbi:MAG: hypothetical protein SNJ71_04925 [Bacteroidales bacterium]
MKMSKTLILSLFVLLTLASCKTQKQKEGIEKTNEMLSKIDFLNKRIDSLDFKKFKQIYDTTKVYDLFISKLPPDAKFSDDEWDLISQYGAIEKCFKKLESHHINPLRNELIKSKSQIENLKHDIKRGFLKDDEIDKYLREEDSILNQISIILDGKIDFARYHEAKYKELHPKMIKLKKSLEEKYF